MTAQVTRETAEIQADHALRAPENAATRIGRALTVHAGPALAEPDLAGSDLAGPELARAIGAAARAHPSLLAEITMRSPEEPYRVYLLYAARRLRSVRVCEGDGERLMASSSHAAAVIST